MITGLPDTGSRMMIAIRNSYAPPWGSIRTLDVAVL
jgi:hypothetical protein